MLWQLTQEQLETLLFPLGGMEKSEVRKQSSEMRNPSSGAPDSQDLCFIPDGRYVDFLKDNGAEEKKGNFVDEGGNVLGTHKGIIHYTVGQKKGLGLSAPQSLYVKDIDPETNDITVVPYEKALRDKFTVKSVNYMKMEPGCIQPDKPVECFVRIRYKAEKVRCGVEFHGENEAAIILDRACVGITPGQSTVFYDDEDNIMFGGFITR